MLFFKNLIVKIKIQIIDVIVFLTKEIFLV